MASGKRQTKTVTTLIKTVTLELSEDEANTLRVILCKVAGDPSKSPRKHVETIADAFDAMNYPSYASHVEYDLLHDRVNSGIRFDNYPEDDDPFADQK